MTGYGFVSFVVESTNYVTYLETTLTVPSTKQAHTGTIFLWPGLQPGGANYDPIDNGVLQPVLTWGPSCAPVTQPEVYSTWWISAQYVNTIGSYEGYTGCQSGPLMKVKPGNKLKLQFELKGTTWYQTVTNLATKKKVTFKIDLLGQTQNYIYFEVELYSTTIPDKVVYENSRWKFASPTTIGCTLNSRGEKDTVSKPKLSANKKTCTVAKIVQKGNPNVSN